MGREAGTEACGWDGVGHPGPIPVGTLGWDGKPGLRPVGGMVWDILSSPSGWDGKPGLRLVGGMVWDILPPHPSGDTGMGRDAGTEACKGMVWVPVWMRDCYQVLQVP